MHHDVLDFDLLHFLHLTPFDDFYETFLWSSNLPILGLICTLQVVSISRFLRSLSSVTLPFHQFVYYASSSISSPLNYPFSYLVLLPPLSSRHYAWLASYAFSPLRTSKHPMFNCNP